MIKRDLSVVAWRKSSYSGSTGGECVEVARTNAARLIRDSKHPHGGTLTLDANAWTTLVTHIKRGHLDL